MLTSYDGFVSLTLDLQICDSYDLDVNFVGGVNQCQGLTTKF